jgi:N-acyl-D-amino-acid deacylase
MIEGLPHTTRIASVVVAVCVGQLGCMAPRRGQGGVEMFDVLIRNGQVVDGTGNPRFRGDVAVRGNRIVAVGRLPDATATTVIDATGLVVAPGFIDLHTHSDLTLLADGNAESKVRQGVTLDVVGEGSSVAPRDGLRPETDRQTGVRVDWTTFTEYFRRLEQSTISMNVISQVSAEQVQLVVKGYHTRPATPQELERMQQLVARSMDEGAWGLVGRFESGGPEFPDEILAMAKTAASDGGDYFTHLGSEGFAEHKELAFAIRVAEEAGVAAHIFHFKIRARENWGTIGDYVRQIEEARAKGLDITANQYPYTAMYHPWANFFPLWARDGGPQEFAKRLQDPAVRRRIRNDSTFIVWAKEHGWWDGIVMSRASTPDVQRYEGMSVAQIAQQRGDRDPGMTLLELMAADSGRINGIFFAMSEPDVREVMRQPWVSIASDGSAINLDEPGVPHPRNYATNARVLGVYVRELKLLSLEDAVRKMTSLPAQILGIPDRGQVRQGFIADLVVLDPRTVGPTNSYEHPKSYAAGVPYVLVNGVVVISGGAHTGARPGRALRGRGYRG